MDTIRKKLASLKARLEEAEQAANEAQAELDDTKKKSAEAEEQVRKMKYF